MATPGLASVLLFQLLVAAPEAQSPRDLVARAAALEAEGNPSAALSLLWEAAGAAPGDAEIQNRLGEALERLGAFDAAIGAFRRALDIRPGFDVAARNLVLALGKNGQGPEAVEQARARVEAAPGDPEAVFTLGLALAEQDVEQAIQTLRRLLSIAPRHALARYNLALVLKRVDRLTEAAQELEQAIALAPRPEPYYTLGVIRWHQGQHDRAVRALRAAIELEPRFADAHSTLGAVLQARGDLAGAAAVLRRAIALRPEPGAHYTLGRVLQAEGDADGARRQFAEADRLRRQAAQETEARVWTSVGVQKFDSGDFVGALDQFRRATTVLPEYAPAHYQMGRALQRLGEPDAARSAFVRAQQLNPSLVPPR
jgi:tetratricopeptide (TPR) repeat protein